MKFGGTKTGIMKCSLLSNHKPNRAIKPKTPTPLDQPVKAEEVGVTSDHFSSPRDQGVRQDKR
jgi:hypothetical protein